MTVLAVVSHENKIYMAGDRGASDDNTILALTAPKVWKLGPYLLGYAGALDGERIRYNFNPYVPDIKDLDKFMQTKFIKQLKNFYNDWWVDTGKEADLGLIICIKGQIYEHNAVDMSLSKDNLDYLNNNFNLENFIEEIFINKINEYYEDSRILNYLLLII